MFMVGGSMRAIWKVIFSELITKQAMRKKVLFTKKCIHTFVLFSVVTTGIEALVISWNKLLCACVKEVCHL
jgi:hypothetical protein